MNDLKRWLVLCSIMSLYVTFWGSVSQAQLDEPKSRPEGKDQIEIKDVEVRLSDHGPVILLKFGGKAIPIFVDPTVAGSVQAALTGQKLSRPLSHDLMRTILDSFGGKVTQTVITLKDGVFYGALTVAMKDTSKVFDSRASDSIALAIHFKAPILVGKDLLESAGKVLQDTRTQTL